MSRSKRIDESVEQMLESVENMKAGADLDCLLVEEIGKIKRILYEEGVARREGAAAGKAAFPPLWRVRDAPARR